MKIPRDVNGTELVKCLERLGYIKSRQVGSHIRLSILIDKNQYHITIPEHNPIKIGTLNNILKEVAKQLGMNKEELIKKLFH